MTDQKPLTNEEIKDIDSGHQRITAGSGEGKCIECWEEYPCPTHRALTELLKLREAAREIVIEPGWLGLHTDEPECSLCQMREMLVEALGEADNES